MPTLLETAAPELAEARACLERGDVGEALLLLRLAEGSPGPATEVRRLLGLAHLASGDLGAAIEDLAAAAHARPDDPGIRAALDAALERLADRPEPAAPPIALHVPEDPTASAPQPAAVPDEEDLIRELARAGSFAPPAAGGILDRMATAVGRRALPWAVAFFLVGAGGFTAIATFRLRAGSSVADGDAGATPGAGAESGVEQRSPARRSAPGSGRAGPTERATPAAGGTATAPSADRPESVAGSDGRATGATHDRAVAADATGDPAAPGAGAAGRPAVRAPQATSAPRAPATPRPGASAAGEGRDRDAAGGTADRDGDSDPSEEAPRAVGPRAAVPAYAFMERLGLAPPPGGVLDSQNSELLRFLREGAPRDGGGPLVLTFRTAEAPGVVAEFYAREAGVRLRLREVAMGGPFQGVVRTVGRGAVRLADGSRATLTVSHPGVDPASRSLVPETTVRFDVRPAP